jgi:hypothetical protein
MNCPRGRIDELNVLHAGVAAVFEGDQTRAWLRESPGAHYLPPRLALAVDGSLAGNRDLVGVPGMEQRLMG